MHIQLLSVGFAALASVQPALGQTTTKGPCQQLAEYQGQQLSKTNFEYPGDRVNIQLNAEMAYNCSISIPIVQSDALNSIGYLKNYTNFLTTLSYLKNPPKAYQKPGIDILARLDAVEQNIKNKTYSNQYELEVDVQSIVQGTSEGHYSASMGGVLGIFSWTLPDSIISLSTDGKALPQIYAVSDIIRNISNPSPITQIEGQPVYEYLRSYLEKFVSSGTTDVHADWNAMVWSGVQSFGAFGTSITSSWAYRLFQSTTIYNGKSLNITFANNSNAEWVYAAGSARDLYGDKYTSPENIYNTQVANTSNTSPIKSNSKRAGGQYEVVELGPTKDEAEKRDLEIRQNAQHKPYTSVPLFNYPKNPDTLEVNFGIGGIVSGYILKNDSIGVLSLPSYDRGSADSGTTALNFTYAVNDFITKASKAKVKKIVIDLSGNGGGSTFLGYAVFKLFFPDIAPSQLGRVRATSYINTLGSVVTGILEDTSIPQNSSIWQNAYSLSTTPDLSSYEKLDINGKTFPGWKDLFGPVQSYGDNFTHPAKYNLSSQSITNDLDFPVPGYGPEPSLNLLSKDQLWSGDDIIMLHDGYCASTCAIFSEMMKTDGGVKSVAVGGLPEYGAMQGVAGTRGTLRREWADLSKYIELLRSVIIEVGDQAADQLKAWGTSLSDVDNLPTDIQTSPLYVSGAVNALDMIRPSSPDTPQQFTYQASDCRLFYTPDMAKDVTALWRAAGKVASGDLSGCVSGSTGAPGAGRNTTITDDVGYSLNKTWSNVNTTTVPDNKLPDGSKSNDNSNSSSGSNGEDDSGAASTSVAFSGLLAVVIAVAVAI
ncbi:unnamed protein product [Clonostachys byssicola]|uniref:Tail specific protease domain-containing protein n=1 Tax=Clonostachys byssicola TaxID=160290 RepID=A0A9N9UZ60_9HYPO|nr:unnamed protein product [Clonostachys byssicola]